MQPAILATGYTYITERESPAALPFIDRQFKLVINAGPTQIKPEQRGTLLDAILNDLHPDYGVWKSWPEELRGLALTTVKVLGRNPVGSETLRSDRHLKTLVFHSALPARGFPAGRIGDRPDAASLSALEAMRAIANTLVLHPPARKAMANLGVGEACARALATVPTRDHPFLLGRIAFLVTADKASVPIVRNMVNQESVIRRLVNRMQSHRTSISQYDALSELLKLSGNIIRYYPPNTDPTDNWDAKLNPLLPCILSLVYELPINTLQPPLTHALHALLSIPFSKELLPVWYASPAALSGDTALANEKVKEKEKEKDKSPRTIFGRLPSRRKASLTQTESSMSTKSSPNVRDYRTPAQASFLSFDDDDSSVSIDGTGTEDHCAFPRRLLDILEGFIDEQLPGTGEPQTDILLDEILPPALLLAAHATSGSAELRTFFRSSLFPRYLDRTPEAGPLEQRPGLLGTLLRLLNNHNYPNCRDTAGEFLWTVCQGNPAELCNEIGYGNAAGLLFRKGLSGPPGARIDEIPSTPSSPRTMSSPMSPPMRSRKGSAPSMRSRKSPGSRKHSLPTLPAERHPITALNADEDDPVSPFAGLTEDERHREAEKMFVMFDRLSRNPVLKAGVPAADGTQKPLNEALRERMTSAQMATWEHREAERERAEREREELDAENEVARDMAAYRRRMGR